MDELGPGPPKEVIYENTYITEPEGYGPDQKLQRSKVLKVVKDLIQERMKDQQYDPVKGAQTAKQLADDLRERVKLLGYERYKLIIQVTVGQKTGQAMRIVSRCLWDANADNCASAYYENETLYCVCQVYGLYYE
uniref:Flagellar outer dynein arm light chain 2 n=1 Tax=Tetraselmis sp. GSL018 TaxID=582737 RepID=A0A061QTB8_9CHLO|mmetsp:Transcript_33720/g.80037  ORF Transcript_33720/g.80037 Transcript_33720/m.80037 type:complete len:135 (-) Transcript_33720:189-593(-)|eukprot:CAMPEP_0177609948 /NCGR_PEP_ID=MMETSP0419_2-20121207/19448_1 /TAXON_ID=582737 /ORGANISM="Tetraselmis sp., Strain GSL018" /LENGTH=134 /DNA_ID=CAMNT_0019105081 /DNA_START=230 /DNA_END=634 /DNA_ORIENTATION=+